MKPTDPGFTVTLYDEQFYSRRLYTVILKNRSSERLGGGNSFSDLKAARAYAAELCRRHGLGAYGLHTTTTTETRTPVRKPRKETPS